MIDQNKNTPDIERFFYPMDTSLNQESAENILKLWDKLKLLEQKKHDKLLSSQTANAIRTICLGFNINNNQSAKVAKLVRNYYLENMPVENFSSVLLKEMEIDEKTAQEISTLVIQKIINENSQDNEKIEVGKKEEARKIVTKMSLSEILKVYPTAGEQLVTKNHVKLKIFPEPVRPSVKNWITDYTENLGYDRHTSIQRGEYLFKSENGKSLDGEDRGKLSQLLKSFDESTGLEIDTQKKQIVFEKNTEEQIKPEEKSSFSQESGAYCRYAPPAPSDTKFHSELPNQIHLKQDIPEKKPEIPKKTAAQDDGFTVNLRQPMHIRPVTGGDTPEANGINPDNVVNLKQ